MIRIFLDNNVFDFLFEKNINIFDEFPKHTFELCITKEIQFESKAIPETKIEKKQFILQLQNKIILRPFFGFFNQEHAPENQRAVGFGMGEFSSNENEFFRKELSGMFLRKKKKAEIKRHDLYVNETDIDLAVRSIEHIVLSFDDKKGKKTPLGIAYEKNYKVVFLRHFNNSNKNLHDFVKDFLINRNIEAW